MKSKNNKVLLSWHYRSDSFPSDFDVLKLKKRAKTEVRRAEEP